MFTQLNLHKRLALVLCGAALLAFVLAGAGLALFQSLTLEHRAWQIMEPYAQLVSVGTDAAVAFEDSYRAQEILDTLRANPQILEADIYLDSGRILASFSHIPNSRPRPMPAKPDGIYLSRDTAELLQGLPREGRLRLCISLEQLNQETRQILWVFGAGVLVLLVATLGQLVVLRRTIVHPIASLTEAAERVRARADYRHRVPASGTDEVARLGQSFNAMMEAIHEREIELRQLTDFRRTILDNVAYGIISTTPDGMVTSFNPAAERLLGYVASEVVGKQTPALWHDPEEVACYAGRLSAELGVAIAPGFEVFVARPLRNLAEEHEWTFIRKDGMRVPVHLSVTALRDEHERISGYVGLTYDLTERKQAEAELRHYKDSLEETVQQRTAELLLARDAAEAANKAKSVFLANMSHELRTPLNAILGFSAILRKNPLLQENDRRNIEIINRSGEHLLSLINDVLEMAKIEAGRVQLEDAAFDLGGMVRDVMNMMQGRAAEKNLKLILDQSSAFPRCIVGDQARLRQVLINLVGNALKFTLQGGVTIRLGVKNNTRSHLLIEVEDTGPGIALEDQKRVFEPFVQIGLLTDSKGTGLGLSITRQFVQLMHGRISLESTPGKGSLFRVDLPLRQADAADINDQPHGEERDVLGLAPEQAEYRILIVEDQLENQLLLTNLMQSAGFQFRVADNGKQGVELFQAWQPHLILMDRRMPVMDGLEAGKIIRTLPGGQQVKIVSVTAFAFAEQRTEMLAAGMDDFVRKPYRAYEIYECLSRQLGVRYIYADQPAVAAETVALTEDMLAVLPQELRRDLEYAVKSLESERIEAVIQQIAAYDPNLQTALTQLADSFDYPAMLRALRAMGD